MTDQHSSLARASFGNSSLLEKTVSQAVSALLVAALLASPLALAQSYQWTDEDGNVHYGDSIPPEYRDQEQRTLRDGIEIDRRAPALTPEEREEMAYEERLRHEAEKAAALQAQRDERLLRLYGSREDLREIRENRLSGLRSQIQATARNLEQAEEEVAALEEQIEEYEARDEEIPDRVAQRYEEYLDQLSRYERRLIRHEDELEEARDQFDREEERLVELLEEEEDEEQARR